MIILCYDSFGDECLLNLDHVIRISFGSGRSDRGDVKLVAELTHNGLLVELKTGSKERCKAELMKLYDSISEGSAVHDMRG